MAAEAAKGVLDSGPFCCRARGRARPDRSLSLVRLSTGSWQPARRRAGTQPDSEQRWVTSQMPDSEYVGPGLSGGRVGGRLDFRTGGIRARRASESDSQSRTVTVTATVTVRLSQPGASESGTMRRRGRRRCSR